MIRGTKYARGTFPRMDRTMSNSDHRERQPFIDRIANSAMPKNDNSAVSQRGAWWWIFLMPGSVVLWIEYMFPKGLGGAFGSARRRNVPLLRIMYSLAFYLGIFVIAVYWFVLAHSR